MTIKDELNESLPVLVCVDCADFITNGDLYAADIHTEERLQAIMNGAIMLRKTYKYGSVGESIDFSLEPCDCCKTKLAGTRYKYNNCGLNEVKSENVNSDKKI